MHRLIIGGVLMVAVLVSPPLRSLPPKVEAEVKIEETVIEDIPVILHFEDMDFDHLPPAWQKLAMCESSGRSNAVAGQKKQFQGYFQIEYPRTWVAHGGDKKTPPKKATLMEQFHVALHISADRGSKPWPYCGKYLKEEYGK